MARLAGNGVRWGGPRTQLRRLPLHPWGLPLPDLPAMRLKCAPPSTHPGAGEMLPQSGVSWHKEEPGRNDPPKPPSLAPLSEGLDYSDLTPLSFLAPVCLDQGPSAQAQKRGVWKRMWAPRFCGKQNPCPKRAETPLTPKTPDTQEFIPTTLGRTCRPPWVPSRQCPRWAGLTPPRWLLGGTLD